MTDIEQAARAYVHGKPPEWHDNGVGIVQGSHYRSGFVAGAVWLAEYLLSDENVEKAILEAAKAMYRSAGYVKDWRSAHEGTRLRYKTRARIATRAALSAALGRETS